MRADGFSEAEIEVCRMAAIDIPDYYPGANLHFHCGASFMAASDTPLDFMSTTRIPVQVVS